MFIPLLPFLLAKIFLRLGQSHPGTADPWALLRWLRSLGAALCFWPDMKGEITAARFSGPLIPVNWESSKNPHGKSFLLILPHPRPPADKVRQGPGEVPGTRMCACTPSAGLNPGHHLCPFYGSIPGAERGGVFCPRWVSAGTQIEIDPPAVGGTQVPPRVLLACGGRGPSGWALPAHDVPAAAECCCVTPAVHGRGTPSTRGGPRGGQAR